MKLRIRSLETLQSQQIEVPSECSLQRLKELISLAFPSSSSSINSIHLSLNRKDEIQSPSPPDDNIFQSIGIISGDLIFFTHNSNGFSPQTPDTNSQPANEPTLIINQIPSSLNPQSVIPNSNLNLLEFCDKPKSSNMDSQNEELAVGSSFSAPRCLRNVFTTELDGDNDGENHKLLLVAIHAVLLESGFIGFDIDLKKEINGFQFRNNWPKNILMLSLSYTLPGIIGQVIPISECQNGVVILKFQSTGNVVNVYASLHSRSTSTYVVRLNEDYLVPSLNVAWSNSGLGEKNFNKDGIEMFNFWKSVKDDLALPLLIDLCDRAGLVLPPCFMCLPTDLKMKILELLPGDSIAKVSCACSELRYLASNDDLWRLKLVKEFDGAGTSDNKSTGNWKKTFAARWQRRQKMKEFDGDQRIIHRLKRFRRLGILGLD